VRSIVLPLVLALGLLKQAPVEAPLRLIETIDLPSVDGRIDHLAIDSAHERLMVAALGNNTVEVIDLKAGKEIRSVRGFNEPQGILVLPDSNTVVVANGGTGAVQFLDAADFHVIRTVPLSNDADNVRYDPFTKQLYAGYGNGALSLINSATGQRLGDVRLGGHPESFQLEQNSARIFVNVPDAGHIAVIDRRAMTRLSTWRVAGASANYPMALDEAGHRLYVGCRSPAKLLVFDTSSGKIVASTEIVGDTDDLFYDSGRKRVYVSGGEGYLDVIQQSPADRLTRMAHVRTADGARTSLFVPDEHRLYVAVPHRGAQKAAIRIYEVRN